MASSNLPMRNGAHELGQTPCFSVLLTYTGLSFSHALEWQSSEPCDALTCYTAGEGEVTRGYLARMETSRILHEFQWPRSWS